MQDEGIPCSSSDPNSPHVHALTYDKSTVIIAIRIFFEIKEQRSHRNRRISSPKSH